jgi:hypothetical protein
MLNRKEHLLVCLAEECDEIGQRVSKALRFGLAEVQPGQGLTNAERIVEEIVDFFAVLEMLTDAEILTIDDRVGAAIQAKRDKVEKFMRFAEEQGALAPKVGGA